jgi:hypothetical protein
MDICFIFVSTKPKKRYEKERTKDRPGESDFVSHHTH